MALTNVFRTDGWVKSVQGYAVPGAQVWVCLQPANTTSLPPSPLANIFSDVNGLVPITQPIITDGFGHYDFYAAAGVYTLIIAIGGVVSQVYPDQSVGGASGTSGGGTALVLQVNGQPNVNQFLLNLSGANGTTVIDEGNGTVSISGASISLKSNGIPNVSQSILNLESSDASVVVTDLGAGNVNLQVSSSSSVPTLGYMLGPGGISIAGVSAVQLGNIGLGALQVIVYKFNLSAKASFTKMSTYGRSQSGGTINIAIGIYSTAGSLLYSTGHLAITSGANIDTTFTIPTMALSPGSYYMAFVEDSFSGGGVSFMGWPVGTLSFDSGTSDGNVINQHSITYGTAANAATSGPTLPPTLGTLTGIPSNLLVPAFFFEP